MSDSDIYLFGYLAFITVSENLKEVEIVELRGEQEVVNCHKLITCQSHY